MASVRIPPSSYPTYPGGAPINFATECLSLYSLKSILSKCLSSPNKNFDSAFAASVFPTPDGPMIKKLPKGRL